MDIKIDDISERVSRNLNISKQIVKDINRSQWELLKNTIQGSPGVNVKVIYVGKFIKKKLTSVQLGILKRKKDKRNESIKGDI
jgi:hypothetical protein